MGGGGLRVAGDPELVGLREVVREDAASLEGRLDAVERVEGRNIKTHVSEGVAWKQADGKQGPVRVQAHREVGTTVVGGHQGH